MQDIGQQGGTRGAPQPLLELLQHRETKPEPGRALLAAPSPPRPHLTGQGKARSCRAAKKRRWKQSPSSCSCSAMARGALSVKQQHQEEAARRSRGAA